MDFDAFYKDLMARMQAVLKPRGFRKSGARFWNKDENSLAKVVEVQKSQFNVADASSFTVNICIGLSDKKVPCHLQIEGNLGGTLEDGWRHQKWYELRDPNDPLVVNGKCAIRFQEPGKPMQEVWIPCAVPEEAIREVCFLIENKVLPFFDTVTTLEEYWDLYRNLKPGDFMMVSLNEEDLRLYASVYGVRMLPEVERRIAFEEDQLSRPDLNRIAKQYYERCLAQLEEIHQQILEG